MVEARLDVEHSDPKDHVPVQAQETVPTLQPFAEKSPVEVGAEECPEDDAFESQSFDGNCVQDRGLLPCARVRRGEDHFGHAGYAVVACSQRGNRVGGDGGCGRGVEYHRRSCLLAVEDQVLSQRR